MKTNITFGQWFIAILFLFTETGFSQSNYEVYVSSRGNSGVKKYDLAGNYLGDFVTSGSGGLNHTEDILFMPDGTVLVSGFGNTAVKQYDGQTGEFIGDFTTGYVLSSPSKISIGPDSLLYVTQWGGNNTVVRFDLQGNFTDEYTNVSVANGLYHVWDTEGNFYIAEYGNGSNGDVRKFDPEGNDLGLFIDSQELHGPTTPWWDADSNMLVADWAVGKIFMFNHNGDYDSVFLEGLSNPEGVALRPDGDYMLGDWGVDAVHLFGSDGSYSGYFTSGNNLLDPNSVKVRELIPTGVHSGNFVKPVLNIIHSGHHLKIGINTPEPQAVTIRIYNIQGKLVESLAENRISEGQVIFTSKIFGSGIYMVSLIAGGRCVAKRVAIR